MYKYIFNFLLPFKLDLFPLFAWQGFLGYAITKGEKRIIPLNLYISVYLKIY